jgi:hypothetical protein
MLACALLFGALSRSELDEANKQLYQRSAFAVTCTGLCYLAMATGNGLLTLRKTGRGENLIFFYIWYYNI